MIFTKSALLKLIVGTLIIFPGFVKGGKYTQTKQSTRLYTPSDADASGGIKGNVRGKRLLDAFAINSADSGIVYKGKIADSGKTFQFPGLPVGKYDLFLLCEDSFYEGIELNRKPNSLTEKDMSFIESIIYKSEPFFNERKIHRCKGITGSSGKACCILQLLRSKPVTLQSAEVRSDIQVRSIRLAYLEDVGAAGWQLVKTREIVRTEVGPPDTKGILKAEFLPSLKNIRVIDSIKDLGTLDLE